MQLQAKAKPRDYPLIKLSDPRVFYIIPKPFNFVAFSEKFKLTSNTNETRKLFLYFGDNVLMVLFV